MALLLHPGDIFSAKAQALIVPANTQPDLGWGSHIAERVKKLADPAVLTEREKFGMLDLGQACLTTGAGIGGMNYAKCAHHAVGIA